MTNASIRADVARARVCGECALLYGPVIIRPGDMVLERVQRCRCQSDEAPQDDWPAVRLQVGRAALRRMRRRRGPQRLAMELVLLRALQRRRCRGQREASRALLAARAPHDDELAVQHHGEPKPTDDRAEPRRRSHVRRSALRAGRGMAQGTGEADPRGHGERLDGAAR